MRDHVTVIPADGLIIVDNMALFLDYKAPADLHALQWHDGAGHIEYAGHEKPNQPLQGEEDYTQQVLPYVTAWEAEHERLEAAGGVQVTLEESRALKIQDIDEQTAAAITAGFSYDVDGRQYHFSYDAFDQQNFSDTANAALMALFAGQTEETVIWNAYCDKELHRLTLDVQRFLALYREGALAHKAVCMEQGSQRKEKALAAATLEELEAV